MLPQSNELARLSSPPFSERSEQISQMKVKPAPDATGVLLGRELIEMGRQGAMTDVRCERATKDPSFASLFSTLHFLLTFPSRFDLLPVARCSLR